MAKCIYCNSLEVNESDIIPVSLTNAKITKKNVCTLKHNSLFGQTFESDVINKLSYLRDHLDIVGKGKKYPETVVDIKVGDSTFKKKRTKNTSIFGLKPMTSENKKVKLGPVEILKQIAEAEQKKGNKLDDFEEIDINDEEIEQYFPVDLTAFISMSSKRLAAKMAYEWFCYFYNIEERLEDFANIIDYICENDWSGAEELVTYVLTKDLYSIVKQSTEHGSHTFITYENDTSINVLVSFFGVCVYNVKLLDKPNLSFSRNCFAQEFQLSASRNTLAHQSIVDFNQFIKDSFVTVKIPGVGEALYPKEDLIDKYRWELIGLYDWVINNLRYIEFLKVENAELIEMVKHNYNEALNGNLIHIRNLKRFAKEVIDEKTDVKLNPNAHGEGKILFYYLVFQIGKQPNSKVNDALIKNILHGRVNEQNELIINRELEKEMLSEILNDKNYSQKLKIGKEKILAVTL